MKKQNKKQKYLKELKEVQMKYADLLAYHIGLTFNKFANEIYELNSKYFKIKEEKE
jgi:hypothetical protein